MLDEHIDDVTVSSRSLSYSSVASHSMAASVASHRWSHRSQLQLELQQAATVGVTGVAAVGVAAAAAVVV